MGEGKASGIWCSTLYPPKSAYAERGKGNRVAPTPQISGRRSQRPGTPIAVESEARARIPDRGEEGNSNPGSNGVNARS